MTDTKKPKPPRATSRTKTIRVKTTKKRTVSSARWLERQLNDPLVRKAKEEGYRARSVYKIIEMDDKYKFFKGGAIVVDLGSTPGSWTQIAVERVRPEKTGGRVIAMDILPMDPVPDADFFQGDFTEEATADKIMSMLDGKKATVVLSDMAANTTGQRSIDHIRTVFLVELAWDFAKQVLAPNGAFLAKVFQGGTEKKLLADLKKSFVSVKHVKPTASRKESPELYVVCTGFKGIVDATVEE
jgi:23S rRNA (uridine2552-2'-O)-methyltransferase